MKKLLILILIFISGLIYSQTSPGVYTVKNVKINTSYSDFGTAFYGKNKVVFASPKQGLTFTREERDNHQQPFLDLFIGEVAEDGRIIKKQKMPGDINTKYNEGMVSFTKDMKTVYFTGNRYVNKRKRKYRKSTNFLQIFKASIDNNGSWNNVKLLPFNGDDFSSGHPVLNVDDTQLYFISDRPESIGKTDIYVVDIYEDGNFGEPRNLGPTINTVEREMFPFISNDNVLYFSSDGYPGYGELDVFASKIYDSTVAEPINLEGPVNSNMDDFAYIINDSNNKGYFSSNRKGGKGNDDIYSFTASPPIFFECKQIVTGFIRDMETLEIIPEAKIVLFNEENIELQNVLSNVIDGSFSFEPVCNTTYTLKGYIYGYLISEIEISTVNDIEVGPLEVIMHADMDQVNKIRADQNSVTDSNKDTISQVDMAIADSSNPETVSEAEEDDQTKLNSDLIAQANEKVNENPTNENLDAKNNNKTININTIYFDYDKYNIRHDAKIELDKIAEVMIEYPQIKIDIQSHTDSRGKEPYNLKLSDNRANSTMQYLFEKGIATERITGKGFGETRLTENCTKQNPCNSFQHQLNRRSEFSIIQNGLNEVTFVSKNISNSLSSDNNRFTSNSGVIINYNFDGSYQVYTVQVGAFHGKVQTNKFTKLTNLFNHKYDDGFNRYYVGIFETSYEARKYMKLMRTKGFEGAFVVGLNGKKRI
jgi:outer membrane protein OmpA-like peptidoglycan-associated protein